jgi:hypothetical protein
VPRSDCIGNGQRSCGGGFDQQHVGQIIHQVDGVGGQGAFAAAGPLSTVKSRR